MNITFDGITMEDVKNPIIVDQFYCDQKGECPEQVINLLSFLLNIFSCTKHIYIYIYTRDAEEDPRRG